MKKRYLKIFIVLFLAMTLSGCTKILTTKDANGKSKNVTDPATGQALTANIMCQPTNKDVIELYSKSNVDISKLPVCEDFSLTSGQYEGIWTTLLVKPLVWLLINVTKIVKNYGLSIIATTLLIRGIMSPLTKKVAEQSEQMKKAKPELDLIEKKYKERTDKNAMLEKSNEMALIHKKYSIKPLTGCLFSLIQLPMFLAYYEAIQRLPVLFESNFLFFNLAKNPMTALSNGQFQYIIFVLLIGLTTYYSFMMTSADSGNEKSMKSMMRIMVGTIVIFSIFLPTGLAIYWVTNSTFTIVQNLISKRRLKK